MRAAVPVELLGSIGGASTYQGSIGPVVVPAPSQILGNTHPTRRYRR